MMGHVDDRLRALIRVPLGASADEPRREILAWVDTAFNGGLTVPRGLTTGLGFAPGRSAEAILAGGQTVVLETYH